jgi:RimJ/RimL family protein N-acetyltransferase
MTAFPDLDEPLRGRNVELRLAAERDIPEILIAHQDDPSLYLRIGARRPPSGAELGRRTEQAAADRAAGTGAWLTILAPGSDTCRGQLDVHHLDWDHRRAEVGIWVAPGERRAGLGSGALALAGRWLLETCELIRVGLFAEPGNEAIVRAATTAGFVAEGVLRAYLREQGRRVDMTVMSLIITDLEAA